MSIEDDLRAKLTRAERERELARDIAREAMRCMSDGQLAELRAVLDRRDSERVLEQMSRAEALAMATKDEDDADLTADLITGHRLMVNEMVEKGWRPPDGWTVADTDALWPIGPRKSAV